MCVNGFYVTLLRQTRPSQRSNRQPSRRQARRSSLRFIAARCAFLRPLGCLFAISLSTRLSRSLCSSRARSARMQAARANGKALEPDRPSFSLHLSTSLRNARSILNSFEQTELSLQQQQQQRNTVNATFASTLRWPHDALVTFRARKCRVAARYALRCLAGAFFNRRKRATAENTRPISDAAPTLAVHDFH